MNLLHILLVILVLALLIAFHEFGHFICAKTLGVPVKIFSIGFPLGAKPLLSFRWQETDVQLNPLPLGGFCAFMDDETQTSDTETEFVPGDRRFLKNRAIWERAIIISGGVIANMIIAYVILAGLVVATGVPDYQQAAGVLIGRTLANSPAEKAGLKAGDKILSIGGHNISSVSAMQSAVKAAKGQPLPLVVQRLNETVHLSATPSAAGTIGVEIQDLARKRPIKNISEVFTQAWQDLLNMAHMLLAALIKLFSGALPLNQVGGLVEVVHMGSRVSQTGFSQLMYFAALISVELAILNTLPVPALDGGHLFLLILEALRGRPLPRAVEEKLHYAGFIVLMGLGVFLIFKTSGV